MLAFSALVGGSFAFGAMAANLIAPAALTAARFVIAAMVIGGGGRSDRPACRARAARAPWRYLVLGGLFAAYFVLMFYGLKTAKPVSASAVFTLTPVMSAGFGWLLLRQRLTPRMAVALVIGALGALWVIFRGRSGGGAGLPHRPRRGNLLHRLRRPCALHADGAQAEPGRAAGGLHLRHAGRGRGACSASSAGATSALRPGRRCRRWSGWRCSTSRYSRAAVTFVLLQFAALALPSAKVMAYTYLMPSWVILLADRARPGHAARAGARWAWR